MGNQCMKKKLGIILLGLLVVFTTIVYFNKDKMPKEETLLQKEAVEFWVVSDPHYIDKSLTDSGMAFKKSNRLRLEKNSIIKRKLASIFD